MKYYIGFNGVGHGHGVRCASLADKLRLSGHKVIFTTYNADIHNKKEFVSDFSKKLSEKGYFVYNTQPEMYGQKRKGLLDTKKTFVDAFVRYFSYVLQDGVKDQIKIIQKEKPDVIISDGHVSSVIAASALGEKYYIILNQNKVDDLFSEMIPFYKSFRKIIDLNKIVSSMQSNAKLILVPDFEPPNTICSDNFQSFGDAVDSKIRYTGPIVRDEVYTSKPHRFENKTAYVCIGGGQKSTDLDKILIDSNTISHLNLDFLIVNSHDEKINHRVKHIKYQINPIPLIKGSSVVITHGGHTTLMESLACGVPVIGITQETHERYHNIMGLQKRGLGKLLMLENIDKLPQTLLEVLEGPYQKNTQEFSKLFNTNNGVDKTLEFLI